MQSSNAPVGKNEVRITETSANGAAIRVMSIKLSDAQSERLVVRNVPAASGVHKSTSQKK